MPESPVSPGPELPDLRYGFPDSHFICFPYESRRTASIGAACGGLNSASAVEDAAGGHEGQSCVLN
jgi:quinone-modifying oxidoreductase subunit QmoB